MVFKKRPSLCATPWLGAALSGLGAGGVVILTIAKAAQKTGADSQKEHKKASFLRDDKQFLNASLGYMDHVVKVLNDR